MDMNCPSEDALFDEIIEYDEDGSDCSEKENFKIELTRRRPTENQFKMINDFFDQGNYSDVGKEGLDKIWIKLAERLNEIGPPAHSQLEWRRKWSVHKYKSKKKIPDTEKHPSAAAQSKGIAGGKISNPSPIPTPEDTGYFRQNVLIKLDQMLSNQDVIIANQEKILEKTESSNCSTCQPNQYNRYDQEHKEKTESLKINAVGTNFDVVSLKSATEGSQRRKRQQIAQMPPGRTKEMMLTAPASSTPIIIIPGTGSSLITLFNAKDVLQNMTFVTTEEKKVQGCPSENEVLLHRTEEENCTVTYRVVDSPNKLMPHEWRHVVAVFVMGPASQFKGWPWDGNPVEIFSKICAFHLRYGEMKLDTNVARWPVNVLNLSRTERNLDRAVLMTFWEILDKHIAKNKPELRL